MQHCPTTGMRNSLIDGQGNAEHQSGQLRYFGENALNF